MKNLDTALVPRNLLETLDKVVLEKFNQPLLTLSLTSSKILKRIGLSESKINIPTKKLRAGLVFDDNFFSGHSESIDQELILKVASNIGNPLLVFKAKSEDQRFIFIYDLVDNNQEEYPVSLVIKKDTHFGKECNIVLSIFGKRKIPPVKALYYYDDTRLSSKNLNLPLSIRKFAKKLEKIKPNSVLSKSEIIKEAENNKYFYNVSLQEELEERKSLSVKEETYKEKNELFKSCISNSKGIFGNNKNFYRRSSFNRYENKMKYKAIKERAQEYSEYYYYRA